MLGTASKSAETRAALRETTSEPYQREGLVGSSSSSAAVEGDLLLLPLFSAVNDASSTSECLRSN